MAAQVITLHACEEPTGILFDMSYSAAGRMGQAVNRLEQISAIANVASQMEELSPVLGNMLRGLETMIDDTIALLSIEQTPQLGCVA